MILKTLKQASLNNLIFCATFKTSEASIMYLSRLYIENYRSIQKLDLKFSKGKNVIVGKNNAGKSNIIKAIDLILGEKSPTWDKLDNITDTDFFEGNINNEIFIWCELLREENELLDLSESKGVFYVLKKKNGTSEH